MRAIVTDDYGSPARLADVDTPLPGPGEVRIKVIASSLNGFDIGMVGGYFKGLMEHQFPVVLGRDVAGTVDQVGPDVTAFAPGDDVFGVVLTQPLSMGGCGEYVVVPQDHSIARIPAGLDHDIAGALGLAGASAVACLDSAQVQAGDTVLVCGATGGVGGVAVQLAAARGATVIATARPGAGWDHLRDLGVTQVVDYSTDLAAQVRALAPDGVDVVVHAAGDAQVLADLLAPGGRLVSLLGLDPSRFNRPDITVLPVFASPHTATLDALATEVAAGRLRVPLQRSYPLDQVPQAVADFMSGKIGKLSIRIR